MKIRVLQILSGIAIGNQSGGAEYYGMRIALLLDRSQFESAIFSMWTHPSEEERVWQARLTAEGLKAYGFLKQTGAAFKDIPRLIQALWTAVNVFKPQILHSHTERGYLLSAIIHIFHPLHPIAVRTVHVDHLWDTHPRIGAALEKILFPLAFKIEMGVSKKICRILDTRMISRMKKQHAALCYNGIDEGLLNTPAKQFHSEEISTEIGEVRPKVCVIGRLTKQKGLTVLFEAVQIALKDLPFHLFVIGSGPLENKLNILASELDISTYVHFLGSRKDVLGLLPQFDVLVSSSLWEGFPTVILEAMAQKIPVIATQVSGSDELVIDYETGRCVMPGDKNQLAGALVWMLTHPEQAKRMAENAYANLSQFTIQNTAAKISGIYHDILRI